MKKPRKNVLTCYGNLNKNYASQEWQAFPTATFSFVLFLKKNGCLGYPAPGPRPTYAPSSPRPPAP